MKIDLINTTREDVGKFVVISSLAKDKLTQKEIMEDLNYDATNIDLKLLINDKEVDADRFVGRMQEQLKRHEEEKEELKHMISELNYEVETLKSAFEILSK